MIVTSTLMLCNTSVNKIAYRIKTTNCRRYVVQPSFGFVDAGSTTPILVILQKHQAYPLDLADCKDTFLVRWVSVQPQAHKFTGTMFDPWDGGEIHVVRLRTRLEADSISLATTAITKPSRWKLLSLKGLFQSSHHSAESTSLHQQIADLHEQKALRAGQGQDEVQQAQAHQNKHLQPMVRLCSMSKPKCRAFFQYRILRTRTGLGPSLAASSQYTQSFCDYRFQTLCYLMLT